MLNIKPDGIYVDGTLGGGGHSYEICRRLSLKGRLIGIDQDEAAIRAALDGHLCRCGTYPKIIGAIQRAAAKMQEQA